MAAAVRRRSAVLYHYPCPDGAFAALAAHLYFKAVSLPVSFFPNTVYDPIRPNQLPVNEFDDVYLLDFVGPSGFVREISSRVKRVIVLDHHKTALEMLHEESLFDQNVSKVLDMDRSGATISFDYFRSMVISEYSRMDISEKDNAYVGADLVPENQLERVRCLFTYIEDGDLWRWKLPDSKAFSSGLKDLNIEFNVRTNPHLFDQAVYADSISELRSELGNQLANKSHNLNLRGIGAVIYRVPELENHWLLKISLRSLGSEDTTSVSQEYGGGGHKNASSFLLKSSEFEKWKVGAPSST